MATFYLVRHAQASFGAADYDQLSPLGLRQSVRLGQYFASRRLSFDAVVTGTLKRHAQTLAGISEGLGAPLAATPWPGLDEYDGQALIAAIHPEPLTDATTAEHYRYHFRQLRQGLLQWMLDKTQPVGMPNWQEFRHGVVNVLRQLQASDAQNVLLVSSGGPIACAISHVLAIPPESTVELNMRLRNTSVTELSVTPKRLALQTYNTLPHLDSVEFDSWITHA
ncbi:histidine phosphatase family protein [Rhodoferax sp.]|uniref:histidine phosphatase family protein n=1 Tax=Rhodoferax sp. TaxID=50421 RepID=UPI00284B24A4|nr:histidine phosphatase family protein [Rhodoferax sp.]MDR3371436.1 histidine phosphatase family protein [Rhodoferax sp.]